MQTYMFALLLGFTQHAVAVTGDEIPAPPALEASSPDPDCCSESALVRFSKDIVTQLTEKTKPAEKTRMTQPQPAPAPEPLEPADAMFCMVLKSNLNMIYVNPSFLGLCEEIEPKQ